jgi:alkanesulfonate monooxygenase SsuD/methylene tetrahydromethanopterin reductase-like flavin-dependent oxidoreductase (luciferase family)
VGFRLAVALDSPSFRAADWAAQVLAADAAGLDLVTFDDEFGGARPDAVLVAARVAPLTRQVGLMPVATTTHTEPFHLSTALATLDFVSGGRAGWLVAVSATEAEAALVGRRPVLPSAQAWAEAADAVEVVRRLWDSWADDAIIKDAATGRYIDRDKLHYIDFSGPFFSVRGPSITPRPPQGQPVIAALGAGHAFADLAFVQPGEAVAGPYFVDLPAAGVSPKDLTELHAAGATGFRLLTDDVPALVRDVLPGLGFEPSPPGSLRARLGLEPAVNRYAAEVRGG